MNQSERIDFQLDLMLAEALIGDGLTKNAQDSGIFSSLVDKVKEYIGNNIDPQNPSSSLINILAPGVIGTALSAMGLGWFGWLTGLALRMFHVDVASILSSVWSKLKVALSDNQKTTSQDVHNMVINSMQEQVSSNDMQSAYDGLKFAMLLRSAKLMRVSMEQPQIKLAISKGTTVSILGRVLSLFFRVAVASAGLMVAGDVANHIIGAPSALDNTVQQGHPIETAKQEAPSNNSLVFSATNNSDGIASMLLEFARQLYPDQVNGQEDQITNLPNFKRLVDTLAWYNHTSEGGSMVFIPKVIASKNQLVDYFMHDFKKQPTTAVAV